MDSTYDENVNGQVEEDDGEISVVSDDELLDKQKNGNLKLNIKSKKNNEDDDENSDEDENEYEDEDDVDDDDEDDNAYITDGDEDEIRPNKSNNIGNVNEINMNDNEDDDADEDDDEDDENYLKKFDKDLKKNYLESYHPEAYSHNFEEVKMLSNVVRDKNNNIIDPLHKTIPIMTKFEKSRVLGQRAKQIDSGAMPFVKVDKTIIDGYLIALKELEEKKIPFIIKRPLPNGGFEYWNVNDLELVC
jgi:DNA-directed RNA polymerase I, II, and III subunit RPABC2